mgnify:FL=1|jgi:hypothetical protein
MKKLLFTLAITLGLAVGGMVLATSNVLACGGKDKDATTEHPTTGGDSSTQS